MLHDGHPWLFLDASGVQTRVGVWQNRRWLAWRESEPPALEALFAGAREVLGEAGVSWEKLDGYIYIEGPGSVLGLRVAAMAVRAWQTDDTTRRGASRRPVLSGGSLNLAATLALAGGVKPPFTVFTDAKQGFWQILEINSMEPGKDFTVPPQEISETNLPKGPLFHLPARKAWHRAPERAQLLPVSLREYPEILSQPGVLRAVEMPTPYAGRSPEYKKWAGTK